jgi:hypothetical protein
MDTSAKALVEFWTRVAQQGLMKPNTANSYKSACVQILGIDAEWEQYDVKTLDVEELFRRFENKRHSEFTPQSLEVYKRRLSIAIRSFLEYSNNPSGWKPGVRKRNKRAENPVVARTSTSPQIPESALQTLAEAPRQIESTQLIDYPFPLRGNRMARLSLPADLCKADVRRLCAFITALGADDDAEERAGVD